MRVWQRKLKVGKVDVLGIDVTDWADGEAITGVTVTEPSGLTTVGATNISGGILTCSFTGVTAGQTTIEFSYTTATRSDCYDAVAIVEEC